MAKFIFKKLPVIMQLGKFAETGVLNTIIDLGILNLLMWVSGITSGVWLILMNVLSFSVATTNSYFWNKFWTFEKKEGQAGKEFTSFFVVSLIGIAINTGIVFAGSSFVSPLFGVSAGAWVNIVKLLATVVSMIWNFMGYKFIVFKK